ncbi:hypothetical protein C2S51_032764 [Perilla frutescens var. frutescens]|nr:hypothetical protein C2S51_032764 [Perilla frutescens var. frutescens]
MKDFAKKGCSVDSLLFSNVAPSLMPASNGGFEDYVVSGGELAYQKLCSKIILEFNDCSKQVLEMESVFASPDCCRRIWRGHECVYIQQITEESGTEETEADSEYDNALKEAITRQQDTINAINEHLEEVRYEIAALEGE